MTTPRTRLIEAAGGLLWRPTEDEKDIDFKQLYLVRVGVKPERGR